MNGKQVEAEDKSPKTTNMDKALLEEEDYSNDKLPEEILELIFQKIEHIESLLNCRLICKYWKSKFDNSSRVMKELTFVVSDWRLFNKSTIVDKVKSVAFNKPFLVTEEESKSEWVEFCNWIGSTVEKIKFNFCYTDDDAQQAQLINSLVDSCVGLKELDLNQDILDSLQQSKYENIHNLVLTTFGRQGDLNKALILFPNLTEIEVQKPWIPDLTTTIVEYAKARKGSLNEVILRYPTAQNGEDRQDQLKFVFTCANFGFKLPNYEMPVDIDNEDLISYEEAEDAPVNEITCKYFQFAWLTFVDEINPLVTHRIGFCKNIITLSLSFSRPVAWDELSFLPKLQKLENLELRVGPEMLPLNVNPVNSASQITQYEFTSLFSLTIVRDIFGPAINEILPSLSTCFPNLKTLLLGCLKIVPNDIFVHLSKFEFLEEIVIYGVGGLGCQWTDEKFILPCESQRVNIPGLVPAITAFKDLTKLTIKYCPNLTGICVQGIAKSNTLKTVSIISANNGRITETSINSLQGSVFENGNIICKA